MFRRRLDQTAFGLISVAKHVQRATRVPTVVAEQGCIPGLFS